MKKFFKYALILLGFDVLLFVLLALKPVPSPLTKAECLEVNGIVRTVSGGGVGDLVITLQGDEKQYYINRLLTSEDETFDKWYDTLKGKAVTLYYPNYWLRHLSMVEVEGEEVWGEFGK